MTVMHPVIGRTFMGRDISFYCVNQLKLDATRATFIPVSYDVFVNCNI